jgi:preprotein translocase subunit SecG
MNAFLSFVVVVQVVSALTIIVLVLLQQGKGADMGAAFGSGTSGSLFGASGSSNFLSRSTAVAAVIFFLTTLSLVYFGYYGKTNTEVGIMEGIPTVSVPASDKNDKVNAAKPVSPASVPASSANQIPK